MKHIRLILALCALACSMAAAAQDGLAINGMFAGQFKNAKGASETYISGGELKKMNLRLYRSVTIDKPSAETVASIERLVKHDGASAVEREVQLRSGRLYYGLYSLEPRGATNRYILYLNNTGENNGKLILVYLEGKADIAQLKKMLKK